MLKYYYCYYYYYSPLAAVDKVRNTEERILRNYYTLSAFDNKMLRRTCGAERQEVTDERTTA